MNELYYSFLHGVRSKVTAGVCLVASVGLIASVPAQKTEVSKMFALAGALGLSLTATANLKTSDETRVALDDFRISTGIQRQRSLFGLNSKPTDTAPVDELPWFDLQKIGDNRDDFPNVFIMGAPGTGKTSLAEYLGVVLKADSRYAIHPHAKPTDFAGFDGVFGGGRNYGTPDDDPLTWQQITEKKVRPTIAQVLMSLLELMNERYEQYYKGHTNFTPVDVYIDELPSIASNLGKKFMASVLPALIMECRKVDIRLWLLTQGSQVKLLGLEGASDLREGATFIRLGKLALKHTGKNKQLLAQLNTTARHCLVDETAAKLPGWSEIKGAIAVGARKEKTQVSQSVNQPESTIVTIANELSDLDRLKLLADECLREKNYSKLQKLVKLGQNNRELLHHIGWRMVTQQAKAMSAVVKDGWGYDGRLFDEGRALYYELGLDKEVKAVASF